MILTLIVSRTQIDECCQYTGTAIQPEWDIDLVAFIGFPDNQDGHAPPFPEVLSAFQDGLLMQFDDKVSLDGQTK